MTLRARLASLGALALLAVVAAALTFLAVARSSEQQRIERTEEDLADLLELWRDRPFDDRPLPRRLGRVGILAPGDDLHARDLPPRLRDQRDELRRRALSTDGPVFARIDAEGGGRRLAPREGVLVVAARATPQGAVLWSARMVPTNPALRRGRLAMLALAALAAALTLAALRTVAQVRSDTDALRRSLRALGTDLGAAVESPRLGELAEVADGLRALAQERARLETELAARDRLAALGRVVAGVAHEVRNPLASMKLKVDLARMSQAPASPLDADLRDLGDEIARLDRLVADLLVVAGRRRGPVAPADLGALVAQRAALLDAWAAQRGVSLDARGEGRATVDADAVTRVVDNLLRNAVEASPAGSTVRATVERGPEGLRITVEDPGPGVPPDRVGELFEPFFTTRPEGTGLGLAVSRAVAEAHGGTLRYDRAGATTRFTLTLPA